MAATCFSILAGAKRHRIEPLAYVRALLVALSSDDVDLETLLPDVGIAAHHEHFVPYRRDEAEGATSARRRRRERRRAKAPESSRSPWHGRDVVRPATEELAHPAPRSWGGRRSLPATALDIMGPEGCPRPSCSFAQRLTLTGHRRCDGPAGRMWYPPDRS
jgi:hypothetical protein